jgi:hypothetical protein
MHGKPFVSGTQKHRAVQKLSHPLSQSHWRLLFVCFINAHPQCVEYWYWNLKATTMIVLQAMLKLRTIWSSANTQHLAIQKSISSRCDAKTTYDVNSSTMLSASGPLIESNPLLITLACRFIAGASPFAVSDKELMSLFSIAGTSSFTNDQKNN